MKRNVIRRKFAGGVCAYVLHISPITFICNDYEMVYCTMDVSGEINALFRLRTPSRVGPLNTLPTSLQSPSALRRRRFSRTLFIPYSLSFSSCPSFPLPQFQNNTSAPVDRLNVLNGSTT
ncbi:hypothetical protein RB195_025908 [Necator americanus]|uniref:Uncharacterized protein n=1 Tax=Necator americanus TaxID=51031 RepID=A0ABR1EUI1_NECAM